MVEALRNTLATAQPGDALFTTQARQDDPELLFSRLVLARFAFDTPDQLVSGILRCSGSLLHLRFLVASMNQKSSVTKTSNLSQRCRRQTPLLILSITIGDS